jgi:MYXO-CTERM domain-containing protein
VAVRGWLIGLALAWAASASAQELRIQFAEKVAIPAAAGHAEFDAYGRRFSLDLEPNDRLVHALNAARKQAIDPGRVLRGELRGIAHSWVRLARIGDALEGAIWDGRDLYVVTSKSRIDANLTLPLDGAPSQTVVYRLSDTLGALPPGFCGLDVKLPASAAKARTGLEQYRAMVAELSAGAAALAANEQLDVSLIADTAFQTQFGQFARDAMIARLNTVDGIFSDQVGVRIVPTELRMIPAGSDPFTSPSGETLLDQLATYRSSTPEVRAAGIAHLMTGKNLTGSTVGIAYLDSLCDPREGVSLSDSELGDFFSALVMAHELGHNFGAAHDGIPMPGCATTPPTGYLMAPELGGSATFSQCSLLQMRDGVARARGVCITSPHYADLALDFPAAPFEIPAQQEFGFPMTLRSVGTEAVRNASLRVELPSQIAYQSVVGATCTVAGTLVTCQVGDVPAGETRAVELRLISSVIGSYTVAGEVAADNDYVRSNNARRMIIGLTSAVDLGVQLTAGATQVYATDAVDFTIDVSSTRTQAAHGGVLGFNLGFGAGRIESIEGGPHACAVENGTPWAMRCNLADVPSGTSTRVIVHARAVNPGPYLADASVTVQNDGDTTNNSSRVTWAVRAEREVVTTVSTENLRAVIGTSYDLVYTLTSVGRAAATTVNLSVSNPTQAIETIVPSAGTCTTPGPGMNYECSFGTLDPGAVRTVTVRLRFDAAMSTAVVGATSYMNGTQAVNNAKFTWVYANLRVDAQASIVGNTATLEGLTGTGTFELQSTGIEFAQNVVATLDVPAPIRLLALRTVYNPHGFDCVIVTPQRARCTGSYGVVGQEGPLTRVQFDFTSDTATTGTAQLTLTADADGNPDNDSAQADLRVNQYIDVGIALAGNPDVVVMNVGEVTPVNLVLTTGRNPATHVYVSAMGLSPWYRVDSISVNGADCARGGNDQSEFGNYYCEAGTVPANSSYPVIVRYRALQGGVGQGGAPIYASGVNDATNNNNVAYFNTRTIQPTDVRLAVAQPSATAVNGNVLRFPLITVSNSGSLADDIVVNIPLPAFATIETISSSGNCAGTALLQCSFESLASGGSATIDISLRTSAAGTFTSNVTMVADEDSTSGNNAASVALTVNAAPAASGGSSGGSSSGGGKGGGRIEWVVLALLALLAARRLRRQDASPRPARATRH